MFNHRYKCDRIKPDFMRALWWNQYHKPVILTPMKMIIVIFFFTFVISHSFSYVNKDCRMVDNVSGKLLLVYVHEITFF